MKLLSFIPLKHHKSIAGGLAYASLMAALFGFMELMAREEIEETEESGHLWWKKTKVNADADSERVQALLVGIALLLLSCVLAYLALRVFTTAGRLKKYVPMLKGVESLPVERLAAIAGVRVATAYGDLRTLIGAGMLDDYFIDHGTGEVVNRSYVPERSQKAVVECPGCGTRNEVIIGIPKSCRSCGEPVALRFSNDS